MGLALISVRQLANAVFEPALTTAVRLAANPFDLGQRCDQNGIGQGDLPEPADKHAANVAGMAADTHRSLQSDIANKYQKMARKERCEKRARPENLRHRPKLLCSADLREKRGACKNQVLNAVALRAKAPRRFQGLAHGCGNHSEGIRGGPAKKCQRENTLLRYRWESLSTRARSMFAMPRQI